jgi:hypothetical protein
MDAHVQTAVRRQRTFVVLGVTLSIPAIIVIIIASHWIWEFGKYYTDEANIKAYDVAQASINLCIDSTLVVSTNLGTKCEADKKWLTYWKYLRNVILQTFSAEWDHIEYVLGLFCVIQPNGKSRFFVTAIMQKIYDDWWKIILVLVLGLVLAIVTIRAPIWFITQAYQSGREAKQLEADKRDQATTGNGSYSLVVPQMAFVSPATSSSLDEFEPIPLDPETLSPYPLPKPPPRGGGSKPPLAAGALGEPPASGAFGGSSQSTMIQRLPRPNVRNMFPGPGRSLNV